MEQLILYQYHLVQRNSVKALVVLTDPISLQKTFDVSLHAKKYISLYLVNKILQFEESSKFD